MVGEDGGNGPAGVRCGRVRWKFGSVRALRMKVIALSAALPSSPSPPPSRLPASLPVTSLLTPRPPRRSAARPPLAARPACRAPLAAGQPAHLQPPPTRSPPAASSPPPSPPAPPAARSSLPCRCPPARPRRPLARRRLAAALPTCTARGTSPRPSPLPCDLLTLLPPRRSPRASRLRPLPSLSPPAALPPRPAPRSTRVCARAPHPPPARQQGRRLGGEECPGRHCTRRRYLGGWPR